jgi:small multidrug resistance pump
MQMTNALAWFYLLLAIFAEVGGTTAMKLSAGFSRLEPSLAIFIFYSLSFAFLSCSLKRISLGFAYAIWSGIGTLLIFIIGICFFNEPFTLLKMTSLAFIIVGVMGLKQV